MMKFKLKDYWVPEYLLDRRVSVVDAIDSSKNGSSLYDLATPVRDGVFKLMFQTEENKRFACYLISKFIEMDYNILKKELILYKNVFSRQMLSDRIYVGDFIGKIGSKYISLEMNNTNTLKRNVKYASSLYGDESTIVIVDGKEKRIPIYDEVIQININNFTFEDMDRNITVSISKDGEFKRTSLIIIDIYLPNIIRKYNLYGIEMLNEQERAVLAMFISKREDAIKLSKGDEVLMAFVKKLEKIKKSNEENYEIDEFHEIDKIELGRLYGLEEGRNEGREEGKVEGSKQIAMNMIKKGFDLDTIHDCTNLSLYDIEKLQNASKPMMVKDNSSVIDPVSEID